MPTESTDLDRARGALTCNPILSIRDLEVESAGDTLIISGRVQSFYEKQLAQEAVRAVCQNVQLRNTVCVGEL